MKEEYKEIQLPYDYEARKWVMKLVEEHIGTIMGQIWKKGYDYVVVKPYTNK